MLVLRETIMNDTLKKAYRDGWERGVNDAGNIASGHALSPQDCVRFCTACEIRRRIFRLLEPKGKTTRQT